MPQAEGDGQGASFVESFTASQLLQNQQLKLSGTLRGMFTHIHTLEMPLVPVVQVRVGDIPLKNITLPGEEIII